MISTPKVSVIMPVYNTPEQFLRQAIDSILMQSLVDLELIIINDGSKKIDIESILSSYDDKRIHYFYQDNAGAAIAKNLGLDAATGDYVCFMDPDDYYTTPDTLEKLYNAVTKNNVNTAGGNIICFTPNGEEKSVPGMINFRENKICNFKDNPFLYGYTRFIFNRLFLLNNNLYFPEYHRFEDPPFFIKAMILAKQYYSLTDIVYTYRINYKKISWTEQKVLDIFNGVSDIFAICKQHQLYSLYIEQLNIFWFELSAIYKQTSDFSSVKYKTVDILRNIDESILANHLEKKLAYKDCYCELIKQDRQFYKKWKPYIKWPLIPTEIYYKKKYDDGHRDIYLFGIRILSYQHKKKKT